MRPLRRHLCALCSAVSLVLLVAVGVVWVRSYWIAEGLTVVVREGSVEHCGDELLVQSNMGIICLAHDKSYELTPDPAEPFYWREDARGQFLPKCVLGFGYERDQHEFLYDRHAFAIPHWLLVSLFAPVSGVGTPPSSLAPVSIDTSALTAFMAQNPGRPVVLRIGQVESTFPFQVVRDGILLQVQ
jgi:hypothetical protein